MSLLLSLLLLQFISYFVALEVPTIVNASGKFIIYAQSVSSGNLTNSSLTIMDDHFNVVATPIGGSADNAFYGELTIIENAQKRRCVTPQIHPDVH